MAIYVVMCWEIALREIIRGLSRIILPNILRKTDGSYAP